MKKPGKRLPILLMLFCVTVLLFRAPELLRQSSLVPGLTGKQRTLLRIWTIGAPGGGQTWLTQQLRAFEKADPGVSTWLRTVSKEDLADPDAVLPDIVLYMPGDVTSPEAYFLPLSGDMPARDGLLREELLRCGRWRGTQFGLPLCWGGWVLAIDSQLEPGPSMTPAPTTLLGRPAATGSALATTEPGYPLAAASAAACALQSPNGAALFSAALLLEEQPPLPDHFGTLTSAEVYSAFQHRQCATALLTTGQAAAFYSLTSSGSGFAHRIMVPEEIITDQVLLASITADAPEEAALLLSHLASAEAQKTLASQSLHTVRNDLILYTAGTPAKVEQAGKAALSAINAYVPTEQAHQAAWSFFQRQLSIDDALLPLM